jgi:hypothetical protein
MRLSDLLGSEVVDGGGRRLGKVRDVRVVQDGPLLSPFGASLRIDGLVVGPGALGERMGFHRSNVRGPWMLKAFFEWRHRAVRLVPWDSVAAITEGRIYLATAVSSPKR